MNILSIESSCDETSAAVITETSGKPVLLSNIISSQIDIHKIYGGVVPEIAARAHIENIIPVISEALSVSEKKLSQIDYLAVTAGPGLIGSLVVGVETTKAISVSTGIPVIPLNHLEGHLYANFFSDIKPKFPVVALLVSGGHTMLIYMPDHLTYEVIGTTKDDAAGEAFDKVSKVLGLGYPGGPEISKASLEGDDKAYNFPIIDLTPGPKRGKDMFLIYPEPSLDFSFSGLKTSVINEVKKIDPKKLKKNIINNLAASFQRAVIETLVQNSLRAVEKYKPKTFILSGGVAANRGLRQALEIALKDKTNFIIPESELCTDNAGMMGAAAFYYIKNQKKFAGSKNFTADPNMKIK